MRRLGVPAFSVAHGSATGLSPSPPHLSLRSGVPLWASPPVFWKPLSFSTSAGSLSLGSLILLATAPLHPGIGVGLGPRFPGAHQCWSRRQICWVPDHSHLTLDNPPCLTLLPWPLYLVFPALPILGKPV